MSIDAINRKAMRSREAIEVYAHWNELSTPERLLFARVSNEMRNQPILDVGVGGGRTTAPLLSISRDYTGIDYTEKMLATCRLRFTGVKFLITDSSNMYLARK
jgi:ubiquinone/menaquinone biosynthesis C-methylase UbiE